MMVKFGPAGGVIGFDLPTILTAGQSVGLAAEDILRLAPAFDAGLRAALDEMRRDDETLGKSGT
jgi:hypothetical protein